MSGWTIVPVVLPFAAAALSLMLRGRPAMQTAVGLIGAVLHLAAGIALLVHVDRLGIQVLHVAGWPAPFGITMAVDHLGALLVVITGIVYLAVFSYSQSDIAPQLRRDGYDSLLHVLVGGISGAFVTGDLFNLYVWFEVMLMASFGLLVTGGSRRQLAGGIPYVVINLLATLLFLAGLGLVYAVAGTLNMAQLHGALRSAADRDLVAAVSVLFLTAFGIKAGLFPLFFWLPASYHTPPVAVSAVFSGLLTKVGVYAMIRTFTLLFPLPDMGLQGLLLAAAALTMVCGVLGAAAQGEVRRILSFHIISQVGYMVLGLALFTPLAVAGAVFYLLHHILVKANLFLISGLTRFATGSFDLERMGGIYRRRSLLALLFFVPAFSLAGFPPLSGFWAKMMVIRASLEAGQMMLAAVAALVGLLTVYSMSKIWGEAFWKPSPQAESAGTAGPNRTFSAWTVAPVAVLAAMTVGIGLWSEPFVQLSLAAAHELMNPEIYVRSVLGGPP